jgi:hypothetical protein
MDLRPNLRRTSLRVGRDANVVSDAGFYDDHGWLPHGRAISSEARDRSAAACKKSDFFPVSQRPIRAARFSNTFINRCVFNFNGDGG